MVKYLADKGRKKRKELLREERGGESTTVPEDKGTLLPSVVYFGFGWS